MEDLLEQHLSEVHENHQIKVSDLQPNTLLHSSLVSRPHPNGKGSGDNWVILGCAESALRHISCDFGNEAFTADLDQPRNRSTVTRHFSSLEGGVWGRGYLHNHYY